jgi:ATP phosphoribosyltransferase regulatory subunit
MSSSLSKIPSGVQYIFGDEARARRWIEREAMSVFHGWSYSEIILPIFDYADLFALGMGKEQAEMTYRFTGRDGRLLALRPEMTSLVARTVATRFQEKLRPIRLCYSGEVFRWDEPRAGRQYEFHQIGLEHIGSDRIESDAEVLIVAIEALRRVGLQEFSITLSHVDFFNGIAEALALDQEQRRIMQGLIDRKESKELGRFLQRLSDPTTAESFCRLVTLAGKRQILEQARALTTNPRSVAALAEIERVYKVTESLGLDNFIDIDLGDVAGLDYYTGLTFKVYASGLGTALGRGGRYDELLEKFGRVEAAVGFSLCLDWLSQLCPDPSIHAPGSNDAVRLNSDDRIEAFKQAVRLRTEGRTVELL